MITTTYGIAFNFPVDGSTLIVPLTADVEVHHSEIYYIVKNFKTARGKRTLFCRTSLLRKKMAAGYIWTAKRRLN